MDHMWAQQDGESTAAFVAFRFYRDSRPQRSLLKVYREWKKDATIRRVPGRWQQWARDYQWAARASAYDWHLDSIRRAVTEKVLAEMHAQRIREMSCPS